MITADSQEREVVLIGELDLTIQSVLFAIPGNTSDEPSFGYPIQLQLQQPPRISVEVEEMRHMRSVDPIPKRPET
jgi:hypothetical protein